MSPPASPPSAAPSRAGGWFQSLWPPAVVLLAFVALWYGATKGLGTAEDVLPSPDLVLTSTWEDRASLWPAIWETTKEAVLGILLAIVVAVLLAVAIDWSRTVRRRCPTRPATGYGNRAPPGGSAQCPRKRGSGTGDWRRTA